MNATIDHLVYACPSLQAAVDELAGLTGVRAAPGGQHPGLGTHNALVSLGDCTYLEIIAPDPAQPAPARPRPFGLDGLVKPGLRAWAAAPDDLDAAVRAARANGFDYGEIVTRQRRTPDGGELTWRMTAYPHSPLVAVVPFLIGWGNGSHPAPAAPAGLTLEEFAISAPDPAGVSRQLRAVGLNLPVEHADEPVLCAVLAGPEGRRVVLRS